MSMGDEPSLMVLVTTPAALSTVTDPLLRTYTLPVAGSPDKIAFADELTGVFLMTWPVDADTTDTVGATAPIPKNPADPLLSV